LRRRVDRPGLQTRYAQTAGPDIPVRRPVAAAVAKSAAARPAAAVDHESGRTQNNKPSEDYGGFLAAPKRSAVWSASTSGVPPLPPLPIMEAAIAPV